MASITKRYADALFQVAQKEGSVDRIAEDCEALRIALEDRGLRLFLQNPQIERKDKEGILDKCLRAGGREPHERTSRFLGVVFNRGRQEHLAAIVDDFRARALGARGEVEGVIEVATDMDAEDVARLAEGLGKSVGKKLVLKVKQDESLLGGFRVRVGDRMWDASLRSQLEALGSKLKGIPLSRMSGEQ